MTDAQPLTASEFLNRIVGDSSREQTETPDSRAQTATPDDGLEVVDSEEDEESDREYEPEDGGKTPDPETDTDPVSEDEEEPEADEAGPPYAPAKIEVKDGKIFINGARTPKNAIKKVLLEHESTQPAVPRRGRSSRPVMSRPRCLGTPTLCRRSILRPRRSLLLFGRFQEAIWYFDCSQEGCRHR